MSAPVETTISGLRKCLKSLLVDLPIDRRPHRNVDPLRPGFNVGTNLVYDLLWPAPESTPLAGFLVRIIT